MFIYDSNAKKCEDINSDHVKSYRSNDYDGYHISFYLTHGSTVSWTYESQGQRNGAYQKLRNTLQSKDVNQNISL